MTGPPCGMCEGPLSTVDAVVFIHEPVSVRPFGSDAFAPARMVSEAGVDTGVLVVCPGCADALAHGRAGELVARMEAQRGSALSAQIRAEMLTFHLKLCDALVEGWVPGVEGWAQIADDLDDAGA